MKYFVIIFTVVLVTLAWLLGRSGAAPAPSVVILAASSTGPALHDLQVAVAGELKILANIAASPTLARQIMNGAVCDFVLLADSLWMDELEKSAQIVPSSRRILLANKLVLIGHGSKKPAWNPPLDSLEQLCPGRVAVAEPNSVPAGRYAKQALSYYRAFEDLGARLLVAADVRQALFWVEQGQADCAVVYETDALGSSQVKTLFTFPVQSHAPINYEFATCSTSQSSVVRKKFLDLWARLGGPAFAARGFLPAKR